MKNEGGLRLRGLQKTNYPRKPLVSIIAVVHNGKKHLEQTIQSVLSQSWSNIEYVIVDGGSTDGTLDIIRKYEDRIDHWISEPDKGIYDAMNKGLSLASGDLIAFLNSGDWYNPGVLENVVEEYLRKINGDLVIAGKWTLIFEDLDLEIHISPSLKFSLGIPISHPAMFVPRNVYEKFGKYDLQFPLGADFDMIVRFYLNNVIFHFIDAPIVNYRTRGTSERYYYDTGKEHALIIRNNLPFTTYISYKLVRWKYNVLMELTRVMRKTIGEKATNSLTRRYYNFKKTYTKEWS